MIVDGDQADGLGGIHAADAFDHFDAGKAGDAAGLGFGGHQFIVPGAAEIGLVQRIFRAGLLVDRRQPPASGGGIAQHADQAGGALAFQPAYDAGFVTFAMP